MTIWTCPYFWQKVRLSEIDKTFSIDNVQILLRLMGRMGKRFRSCSLDQPFLLPPSLHDWLPEDHLARFVADVVHHLDLGEIYNCYERKDERGLAAYHPEMLTRLLLYGYAIGESSSRRIEQATYDNVAFRYLAANQHPDHDTIASFRQQHLENLSLLFVQALQMCQKAGLVKMGHVAIDGTKLQANASTHRSMGSGKLNEQEQYWKQQVDEMLRRACEMDETEGRGGQQRCGELPADLAQAQTRLKRLEQAKRELEQEAQQRLAEAKREWSSRGKRGRPRKGEEPRLHTNECHKERKRYYRALRNAACPSRAQNLTDPDSRQMHDTGEALFVQGYNAQLAVDAETQVIVAAEVTQDVLDRSQLSAMMESTERNAGQRPEVITADAGYWNTETVQKAICSGAQVLVPPDGSATLKTRQPRQMINNPLAQRMRAALATETGRALYGMRQGIVEPVIGYIKDVRGFRRFALRGLSRVRAEWRIICTTHNLLKLFRYRCRQMAA
jgi:transposase